MTTTALTGTRAGSAAAPLMLSVWAGEEVAYEDALRWQRILVSARAEDASDDVLLTLTHDRVYTAGRRADIAHHVLGTSSIRVVQTDRGGDVTYHGPGQLVAYPIVRLPHRKAIRPHVSALEDACVRTAAAFGITAGGNLKRPGVWVGNRKLAAVGVRVDQGVTSHGLAFNVTTDLADFDGLVPCGITDGEVCSLRSLGVDTTVEEVRPRLVAALGATLGRTVHAASRADLGLVRA
ncbi:MAG: lipoyl(octanoyl) transferase LipB [Nitriliruptorales bacterium]|nr:lipoyl(octanoyl) transferase LipB [Nitriliruptorales bacterium]